MIYHEEIKLNKSFSNYTSKDIPCIINNIKLYEYPVNFVDMDGKYIDPFRYELAAIIKLQNENINRLIKVEFEREDRIEPGQDSAWIIDRYLLPHLETCFQI